MKTDQSAASTTTTKRTKKTSEQDFSTTIVVDQTPEQVFAAVNDVRGWWSDAIVGRTDQLGAEFDFSYRDIHRTTQRITEFVPGERVVWHVTKSWLGFVADKEEWAGTDIVFDIKKKGAKTELRFTHVGLVPSVECYDKCSGGWTFLVEKSLRALIAKGQGEPVFGKVEKGS